MSKEESEPLTGLYNSCGCDLLSTQIVVSRGDPLSQLMLVGEAPGANEEKQGKPFVGRSGILLNNLLSGVGIDHRKGIYICNLVKSRPPNNRKPSKKEIARHWPWLMQQIKLVQPHIIILAGSTALHSFLGNKAKITHARGTWQNWKEILVMPIFHPSYLLRNPSTAQGAPIDLTRLDLYEVKKQLSLLKTL